MTTTDLPLLVLGHGADPRSERGVDCPGALPPASDPDLVERARAAAMRRVISAGSSLRYSAGMSCCQ